MARKKSTKRAPSDTPKTRKKRAGASKQPQHGKKPSAKPTVTSAQKEALAAETPPKSTVTAETMARRQREISVADFFSRNRHLLGFDNPRKALLTAIKEAVDNALDACEEARILPEVSVGIEPVKNQEDRFRVTVEDNGPGIVRKQIPRIFAKLLYGSKFHTLKMSRGQQGIGISAAAMYGQLTTGNPTEIISRTSARQPAHRFLLMIDTRKNAPRILSDEQTQWDRPHGSRVVIELDARYQKGRRSVDEYLALTAIANPHADIMYYAPGEEPVHYARVADELPRQPMAIKPHPNGIELGALIRMLQTTRARYVHSFLHQDFSRLSARVAREICEQAGLRRDAKPKTAAKNGAKALFRVMRRTKLRSPPTDCVVPIGEELMLRGLRRGVEANFYTTVTRPPSVYRGNPFVIEAGLAYGGDLPADKPVRLMRFANRVPLQYQKSACAISKATAAINWRSYGLSQSNGQLPVGPMTVMVHVASVWVPYTSESKEAVAHYPEILKDIRLALQECGRRLGGFIRKRAHADREARRRSIFERYAPEVAAAVGEILDTDTSDLRAKLLELAEKATTIGAENLPVYVAPRHGPARKRARATKKTRKKTPVAAKKAKKKAPATQKKTRASARKKTAKKPAAAAKKKGPAARKRSAS